MKRPLSVSIIAWFAIVYGAFSLCPLVFVVSSATTFNIMRELLETTPAATLPFEGYILFGLAGSLVSILAGFYMRKGRNWARMLLLVWWTLGLGLVLIFYRFSFILGLNLLFYLVVFYLLTRKKCLTYFGVVSADQNA